MTQHLPTCRDILSISAIKLLFFELEHTVTDTCVADMSFQHGCFSLVKQGDYDKDIVTPNLGSIHSLLFYYHMFVDKNVLLIKKNWEKGSLDTLEKPDAYSTSFYTT